MAGLCEGDSEPPCSLKANKGRAWLRPTVRKPEASRFKHGAARRFKFALLRLVQTSLAKRAALVIDLINNS
ncbi:hypothetical protein ANN_23194 [Periplaneta americana]|uniref:Uncharacterized protein n=1 Tax=Periplaneta americana TaxID=6978 RepID=A0ABQ8SLP3_PERAM|nr:hypothetical protein ANN_23194 [Periplaneta americana]